MDTKNINALITGAGKRLGRAIADDLARQGYGVAIHANGSLEEAEQHAAMLRRDGYRAVAVSADLRQSPDVDTLVERAAALLGPIQVLVNNASVFAEDGADQFDAETYSRHFDLHVRAPMILGAALARQLPGDTPGLIVNIIDQRVWALTPRFFSYTLSKSTLWTMTRTMAQAFAPRIRVNAIGPGPSVRSERQAEADFQAQIDSLPLGRGPSLDEFGRTVRFLFDTPSITGQMIALDGGQHLIWRLPGEAEINE
ncbi:SDR family oxidoreductase [Ciceribacter sp. L1K22]|uniref:SDR family oxidoreductase n=1 Tax=Ciceribacter sp. L1K22 TaxID=2820275 RepID=UPI001ABEE162|nr:SDR family oxidoreductase [Ciceribacter sp. L1K22]MBO3759720.1 SDR family oxidoreductase [Ciceribacter sp. L1K22]